MIKFTFEKNKKCMHLSAWFSNRKEIFIMGVRRPPPLNYFQKYIFLRIIVFKILYSVQFLLMSLISAILLYFPPRRGGGCGVTTTTVSFTVFILNSLLSQPKLTLYRLLSVQKKLSVAVEKKIISHSKFKFATKRLSV